MEWLDSDTIKERQIYKDWSKAREDTSRSESGSGIFILFILHFHENVHFVSWFTLMPLLVHPLYPHSLKYKKKQRLNTHMWNYHMWSVFSLCLQPLLVGFRWLTLSRIWHFRIANQIFCHTNSEIQLIFFPHSLPVSVKRRHIVYI